MLSGWNRYSPLLEKDPSYETGFRNICSLLPVVPPDWQPHSSDRWPSDERFLFHSVYEPQFHTLPAPPDADTTSPFLLKPGVPCWFPHKACPWYTRPTSWKTSLFQSFSPLPEELHSASAVPCPPVAPFAALNSNVYHHHSFPVLLPLRTRHSAPLPSGQKCRVPYPTVAHTL